MLNLGAKFEQARGDSGRAADYYRASLAALPPGDPGAELANELSQPMPVARLPKPAEPQDLATLLQQSDDAAGTARRIPSQRSRICRAIGNVNGQAPVQIAEEERITGSRASCRRIWAIRVRSTQTATGRYALETMCRRRPEGRLSLFERRWNSIHPAHSECFQYDLLPRPPERRAIRRIWSSHGGRPNRRASRRRCTCRITATPQQEIYGPYVPYVPPDRRLHAFAGSGAAWRQQPQGSAGTA